MNQGNMPNNMPNNMSNNQIPMGNVSNDNQMMSSTVPVQSVDTAGVNQSGDVNQQINNSNSVVSTAPVVPVENNTASSTEQKTDVKPEENDVTKILSSSFGNKEKVNLLTPEQKAELIKKREAAMQEKANYQPQPVGKFQKILMAFLLVGLFAIMFFLPEINTLIVNLQNGDDKTDTSKITTGTLRCVKESTDDNYNMDYTYDFEFTDSKLKKLYFYEVIKGNYVSDSEDLESRLANCNLLRDMVSSKDGIRVNCSLSGGTLTIEQVFDYANLKDIDYIGTSYTEAGGEYPGEFALDTDIDYVEKNMNISDFSCERY